LLLLLNIVKKSLAFPKVVWKQFIGEVGKFVIFWCPVASECYVPKIIKMGLFFTEIFKMKVWIVHF